MKQNKPLKFVATILFVVVLGALTGSYAQKSELVFKNKTTGERISFTKGRRISLYYKGYLDKPKQSDYIIKEVHDDHLVFSVEGQEDRKTGKVYSALDRKIYYEDVMAFNKSFKPKDFITSAVIRVGVLATFFGFEFTNLGGSDKILYSMIVGVGGSLAVVFLLDPNLKNMKPVEKWEILTM